ncbi:MAG: hypothetical protein DRJ67_06345 [Thermoprotei archaeon]|nr:MAG: hypothetical protein DRJ67_06345 [Thermoprotei archaeon]
MRARRRSYRKGVRFEYRVRDELTKLGLLVIRAARSRGTKRGLPSYDLVAIAPGPIVWLIECKAYEGAKLDPRAGETARLYNCEYVLVTPKTLRERLMDIRHKMIEVWERGEM